MMKNMFDKTNSPLRQMQESLTEYSDPCATFLTEGPKFYFGNEAGTSPDVDRLPPPPEGEEQQELGQEYGGVHSRKIDTDYEARQALKKERMRGVDAEDSLNNSQLDRMPTEDTRSEAEKQTDEWLATHANDVYRRRGILARNRVIPTSLEDIGDFDVTDEENPTIHYSPTADQLAARAEVEYDLSDLDDPGGPLLGGNPDDFISDEGEFPDDLPPVEDPTGDDETDIAIKASEDLQFIAARVGHWGTNPPEDIKAKLSSLQKEIDGLKASLGEGSTDMYARALKFLEEEIGGDGLNGEVKPASGSFQGSTLISKYQDPVSRKIYVKLEDGRICCVTMDLNGNPSTLKHVSFNPAFPQIQEKEDKLAIEVLRNSKVSGAQSVPSPVPAPQAPAPQAPAPQAPAPQAKA